MNVTILILEPAGRDFGPLRREFREESPPEWEIQLVSSAKELLRRLDDTSQNYLVLLPDGAMRPAKEGSPGLIPALRKKADGVPVVVVAEQGSVDLAARAVAAGANDFLVLGDQLRQRIATLLGKLRGLLEILDRNRLLDEDNAALREAMQARMSIVGRSPQIRRLVEQIQRVAGVPRPVLIVGERGTGKELVARAIHLAAAASSRPIITVNCAAFSDALLESELFGHEKGAFTGADTLRRGKFELADGGTLFLDEVGHMSTSFQEKILRVVEYGTFSRVGASAEMKTAARIIAASNRDLREMIRQGEFLPDLYDRLAFETLEVPPLRSRRGDIEVLAQHFLDQFARETPAFAGKRLSPAALEALRSYSFPGNIRELKNLIERAAGRETSDEIGPEELGLPLDAALPAQGGTFQERLDALARTMLHDALRQAEGNQAQAARHLGLSYHQFRYFAKKYLGGTR